MDYKIATSLPDDALLEQVEDRCEMKLGRELREFLQKYGFFRCSAFTVFGVTADEGLDSDLVMHTLMAHERWGWTAGYFLVCIDGDTYIFCDHSDRIYLVRDGVAGFISANETLNEYLEWMWMEAKENDSEAEGA